MKKINLFISALMICLAILVAGGATVPAMQFQAQAAALRTASNSNGDLKGIELFDSEGRYAVNQAALTSDKVFQFFGYDWRVVYVNEAEKVATFWMADPFAKSAFNSNSRSAEGILKDGGNIWLNGYSENVWDNEDNANGGKLNLGESEIRKFLATEASRILNDEAYAKYQDKVKAGYVSGSNEDNTKAKHTIPHLAFSKNNPEQVEEKKDLTNELTAYWYLNENDRLWLPSIDEIKNIWKLSESNILGWTETTISTRAWLRTPDYQQPGESQYVMAVCSGKGTENYFVYHATGDEIGVRPAIHLNIENIEAEYQAHLDAADKGSKGSWFDEDWLKALFIVVCIIGLVGVALVIIAVIMKARKNKAESQQA